MKTVWFVNYTNRLNGIRAIEIRVCHKLKEAKHFIADNKISGFLIRQDMDGNTFRGFFGGFEPSAQQQQYIDNILDVNVTW